MRTERPLRTAGVALLLAMVAASLRAQVIDAYPTPTQPSFPFGIASGPDGNLWFVETQGGRIGRITPDGDVTEFPTGLLGTADITTGPDGNLWFTHNQGVARMTTTGVLTNFPASTFTAGGTITVGSDGNLWFTEYAANSIGRVTPSGVVTEFLLPRVDSMPLGITTGPDGNLWFTERRYSSIGRITPAGVITEFTSQGFGWQIVAGPDGRLWYTDEENRAVRSISVLGVPGPLVSVTSASGPQGLTRKSNGHLWFTTELDGTIGRLTVGGKIQHFTLPAGSGPREIVEGPNGDLWFTMQKLNSIGRLVITSIPLN